ncbi:MAG: serine/threonine protein kinase [Gammaproteobacteria bacterium]|nr:serine/threonine protein kinase [Gammaproteobacteria bacterium]
MAKNERLQVNALPKGYRLPEYQIEKPISEGGFSVVYLATHLPTRTRVVIKEFFPVKYAKRIDSGRVETVTEEASRSFGMGIKRFFNEGSALAKINHENVVHVTHIFRANNTVYMVMDFEVGRDMRWYIKRKNGGLSEKFLRTVFPEVLSGMLELHKNHILHLDIKPANILLRSGGHPLLIDFGAVKHMKGAAALEVKGHTLTQGFAPIEQHNHGNIGPWSDIYAIGATMYSCITGKPPPSAPERVKKDRLESVIRSFEKKKYSPSLLEAINVAMKMDMTERPQTIEAFMELLEVKAETPSKIMTFLKKPVLGRGKKN